MNNKELHDNLIEALGDISNATNHVRNRSEQLLTRLETAEREALQAGGVNDGWAVEVDRLTHKLNQSTNYVADDAVRPQSMSFSNGRIVRIRTDDKGPYLETEIRPTI